MIKKLLVAIVIVGAFIVYSITYHNTSQAAVLPNSSTSTSRSTVLATPTTAATAGATPPITSTSTSTSTPTATVQGKYKDGTYTGSVADAQWGNIQVQATIKSGKIQDIQFLQYPNSQNRSVMINQSADPILSSEAIQAQSAQVDAVSGATDTSVAFVQSLSDALSQAKA